MECTSNNMATSNITARMATSYNILASLAQLHQRDNVPSILHHQKAILHHEKAILHHQKAILHHQKAILHHQKAVQETKAR